MSQIQQPATEIPEPAPPRTPSPAAAPAHPALQGYRRGFDVTYAVLSVVFLAAILGQVFLAGLGTFHHRGAAGPGFGPHEDLGNILGIAAVVLFLISLVARASWRTVACAFLLGLLTETAQHALAQFGAENQWIGAAHALDGMIILLLAAGLALTSVRRMRAHR